MILLQISLFGSVPRGQQEGMSRLRIQIAANGVNDFTKELSTSEAHTVLICQFSSVWVRISAPQNRRRPDSKITERNLLDASPSRFRLLCPLRDSSILILGRDTKSRTQIALAVPRHALERDRAEGRVGPPVRADDLGAAGDADDQCRLHPRLDVDSRDGSRISRARRYH